MTVGEQWEMDGVNLRLSKKGIMYYASSQVLFLGFYNSYTLQAYAAARSASIYLQFLKICIKIIFPYIDRCTLQWLMQYSVVA